MLGKIFIIMGVFFLIPMPYLVRGWLMVGIGIVLTFYLVFIIITDKNNQIEPAAIKIMPVGSAYGESLNNKTSMPPTINPAIPTMLKRISLFFIRLLMSHPPHSEDSISQETTKTDENLIN